LGLVVAGFLLLSYWHKLTASDGTGKVAGVTTEMSGLATFLVGALICTGAFLDRYYAGLQACCCWI